MIKSICSNLFSTFGIQHSESSQGIQKLRKRSLGSPSQFPVRMVHFPTVCKGSSINCGLKNFTWGESKQSIATKLSKTQLQKQAATDHHLVFSLLIAMAWLTCLSFGQKKNFLIINQLKHIHCFINYRSKNKWLKTMTVWDFILLWLWRYQKQTCWHCWCQLSL